MYGNQVHLRVVAAAGCVLTLLLLASGCTPGGPSKPVASQMIHVSKADTSAPSLGGDATAAVSVLKFPEIARADLLEPPSWTGFEPLPSFTYHHVSPKLKNQIAITPTVFEKELKILKSLGYHSVTARQVVDHQTSGTPLPDKPVMLTFDDGWRNQYKYAWPLLKKYGFTATFFLNPRLIVKRYPAYMTSAMVVTLAKAGNDVESHTWRHLRLTRTNRQKADKFQRSAVFELTAANAWITKTVGQAPVALCYPYGYYDLETIGLSSALGYKAAWSVDEGVADARPWDAFAMKRFTISNLETSASFRRRLLSGPLPVANIQPPPATRVAGLNTTVTVDLAAVPADINGIHLTGGSSLHKVRVVESNGQKYLQAVIRGGKPGFRALTMRAMGPGGRTYYASWDLEMGDKSR